MEDQIYCYNDKDAIGEYFSLDRNVWRKVDYKIVDKNRIGVGGDNYKKIVSVFVMKNEGVEVKKSDNLISFSRKDFVELRKVRGDEKGLHLEAALYGYIWLGKYAEKNLIVFVRRDINEC